MWAIKAIRNANQTVIGYEVGHYYPSTDLHNTVPITVYRWERLWAHYNSDNSNDSEESIRKAMANVNYLNGGN